MKLDCKKLGILSFPALIEELGCVLNHVFGKLSRILIGSYKVVFISNIVETCHYSRCLNMPYYCHDALVVLPRFLNVFVQFHVGYIMN